jgi:hypothetical protein
MATLKLEEVKDAEDLRRMILERRRAGGPLPEWPRPEPPSADPEPVPRDPLTRG